MPVEIREVVIKAQVNQASPSGRSGGSAGATAGKQQKGTQDEIVRACVEQVMQILEDKKSR